MACGGSIEGYCTDCIPGKFVDTSSSVCTDCSPGTYQAGTNQADCADCPTGKYQTVAGQPFCESVEEGRFVSVEPAERLEQQLKLPHQNGALSEDIKISLIEALAAHLDIDPKYIRLSGGSSQGEAALPIQRQRQRVLTEGFALRIAILSDGSGVLAAALAALTSNQTFWQAVKDRLTAMGASSTLDASDIVVQDVVSACNTNFKYDNMTGSCSAVLMECAKGTYAVAGTGKCLLCPSSKYSGTKGAFACDSCTDNANSSIGASSSTECVCGSGYYKTHDSLCDTCPPNADCGSGSKTGFTLATLRASKGYWRATNSTTTFHPCPARAACVGEIIGDYNKHAADQQCRAGHTGLLCMVCAENYVKKIGNRCVKCEDGEGLRGLMGVLAFFVVFFALAALAWYSYKKKHHDSMDALTRDLRRAVQRRTVAFRTFLGFVQVVSRIPITFRFTFPKLVDDFMAVPSFFELGDLLSMIGKPNCLFKVSYFDELFFKVVTPLVVLLLLFGVHRFSKNSSSRDLSFDAFVLVSFVMYPGMCSTLFTYFDCKAFEDGNVYLFAAPSVLCTDAKYKSTLLFVGMMSVLVPFGIPGIQ
jgi:hypothetical protein